MSGFSSGAPPYHPTPPPTSAAGGCGSQPINNFADNNNKHLCDAD
jgi:hypothetical protein